MRALDWKCASLLSNQYWEHELCTWSYWITGTDLLNEKLSELKIISLLLFDFADTLWMQRHQKSFLSCKSHSSASKCSPDKRGTCDQLICSHAESSLTAELSTCSVSPADNRGLEKVNLWVKLAATNCRKMSLVNHQCYFENVSLRGGQWSHSVSTRKKGCG